MKKLRKPKIENKYNLKPGDITKAVVLDYDKLHKSPFWRNDVIKAWCLTGGSGKGYHGDWIDSFWIGFYDLDVEFAGKIRFYCTSYEDMCGYEFKSFFDYSEIENEVDLELQEKLLEKINWMIDEKIIKIEK